jgi:hypothetical protein
MKPASDVLPAPARRRRTQRLKLLLVLAVCAAPVIASYLAYYVFPPEGRTNYGTLIEPQRPVPTLRLARLDGSGFDFATLKGRWVMLQVDRAACGDECREKLLMMRQQRTMTGKDRDRLERVWLVTDAAPLAPELLSEFEGTIVLRAARAELEPLLPVAGDGRLEDHIWIVDPRGNVMMRHPKSPDPQRVRSDIARLLRAQGRAS